MERDLPTLPRRDHACAGKVLGAVGLLQIASLLFQSVHTFVEGIVGVILEPFILHLELKLLKLGGDLIDALLGSLIRLDRAGIDAAIVGPGRVIVADHGIGPGKAQLYAGLLGGGRELLEQDGFDQRSVFQHRMLFQEIGCDGPTTGLVFLAHEGTDVVADLHPARFERLTDGVGLQIAVFLGERVIDLALHLLARMLRKGLHRVERDRLGPGRGADIGVDQAVAQPAFHGRHRGAEGLGYRLGRLAVDFHHPGEGLELVDGIHRRLGDVLSKRQGRGDIAILWHKTAVHLGLRGEALRRLVGDQLLQRGMAPATGEHGIFAVELLDKERLKQTQNSDAGLQMRDVFGIIGFRGVTPHICGVSCQIADSDGEGFETCGHGVSFQVGEVWPAPSRA